MVNIINTLFGVAILLLVMLEWQGEAKKSGKAEATKKTVFGALVFAFFYGIVTSIWSLSFLAFGILVVLMTNREVGFVVVVGVLLMMGISILGYNYSFWFFLLGLPVLAGQWFLSTHFTKRPKV